MGFHKFIQNHGNEMMLSQKPKPVQKEEYTSLQVSHLQGKSSPLSTKLECIKRGLFALEKL